MKTNGINGMSFGFSTVNAGQRNVVVEPQLVAVSTEGNFRLTPPVTRILGIGHGDHVMFINNVANIDAAIAAKDEVIVNFCNDNGLEIDSPEAAIAIHKEFDMWAIAKGIQEYDAKGNLRTTSERLTKSDKYKFVSHNFDAMLEAAMNEATEEVKDALSRDGVTREEQIDILSAFVTPRELPKYKGSKASNSSGMTGAGTSINFTDSNVWKQLKADMGDDANRMNRVFSVDIENIQTIILNDGFNDVSVKIAVLGESFDKEATRISRNSVEE